MQRIQKMVGGSLTLGLIVMAAAITQSQTRLPTREWRYFGGDKAFTRYSPLDQVTRDNVKNLRIVWRRPAVSDQLTQVFPDLRVNNSLGSTPIVIDGPLYTQNAHGLVVAIDGEPDGWPASHAATRNSVNGESRAVLSDANAAAPAN